MPSANVLSAADVINLLIVGIDKTTLESELTALAWISTPARGGSKSSGGQIWTSPNYQSSARIMTKPDGSFYAHIYNHPGGGAPAEQPLNAFGQLGLVQKPTLFCFPNITTNQTMSFEEIWQDYDFLPYS